MFRIAILGCENSHANSFLKFSQKFDDVEFAGVYSDEQDTAQKLSLEYGVPVMESFDELSGKADGVMITARHGDNHLKYAKPYIKSGIPIFIDKPVTCSNEDAIELIEELKKYNVKVSGGSSLVFSSFVQKLKEDVKNKTYGKVLGGFVRSSIDLNNKYGGFHFYAQHLVHVACEIFGYYPKSVKTFQNTGVITCVIRYEDFDITGQFVEKSGVYSAHISCENAVSGGEFGLDGVFEKEFMEYYNLLKGESQKQSYEDFIAPVFIMNAIDKSLKSGKEEKIDF